VCPRTISSLVDKEVSNHLAMGFDNVVITRKASLELNRNRHASQFGCRDRHRAKGIRMNAAVSSCQNPEIHQPDFLATGENSGRAGKNGTHYRQKNDTLFHRQTPFKFTYTPPQLEINLLMGCLLRQVLTAGCGLILASANGKLIFRIFTALAEFERDRIRERTKAGLTAGGALVSA
jgi:hypothetical protein